MLQTSRVTDNCHLVQDARGESKPQGGILYSGICNAKGEMRHEVERNQCLEK